MEGDRISGMLDLLNGFDAAGEREEGALIGMREELDAFQLESRHYRLTSTVPNYCVFKDVISGSNSLDLQHFCFVCAQFSLAVASDTDGLQFTIPVGGRGVHDLWRWRCSAE